MSGFKSAMRSMRWSILSSPNSLLKGEAEDLGLAGGLSGSVHGIPDGRGTGATGHSRFGNPVRGGGSRWLSVSWILAEFSGLRTVRFVR